MDWPLSLTVVTVAIVVLFDYTNGFHDASNVVAMVIASRAMRPLQAVVLVAFFEFLGPLLEGTAVANTIGNFVRIQDLLSALPVRSRCALWCAGSDLVEFSDVATRYPFVVFPCVG